MKNFNKKIYSLNISTLEKVKEKIFGDFSSE